MSTQSDLRNTIGSIQSLTQAIDAVLTEKKKQEAERAGVDGLFALEQADSGASSAIVDSIVFGRGSENQSTLTDGMIDDAERTREELESPTDEEEEWEEEGTEPAPQGEPGPNLEREEALRAGAVVETAQMRYAGLIEPVEPLQAPEEDGDAYQPDPIRTKKWMQWNRRHNHPDQVITIEMHEKAWEAYKHRPTVQAVQEALPDASNKTVVRLITLGAPTANIPSLERKLAAVNMRINQMDIDETAKSIAAGRFAIRKMTEETLKQINAVLQDPERVAKVPPRIWLQALPKFVALNEQISRTPVEGEEAAILDVSGDVQGALGGLLDELASRRIPTTKGVQKCLAPEERHALETSKK